MLDDVIVQTALDVYVVFDDTQTVAGNDGGRKVSIRGRSTCKATVSDSRRPDQNHQPAIGGYEELGLGGHRLPGQDGRRLPIRSQGGESILLPKRYSTVVEKSAHALVALQKDSVMDAL